MPLESIRKIFLIDFMVSMRKKRALNNEKLSFVEISGKSIDSAIEKMRYKAIRMALKSGVDPFRIL